MGISLHQKPYPTEIAKENPRTMKRPPNFIIIFTDDQGYQDLGCFGSPDIATPRIDQMARAGLKLTSFYAQPVCGPSRAALMTGCYPMRAGFPAIVPDEKWAIHRWRLNPEEVTIAEVLKTAGYATGCVGKWDLSGRKHHTGEMPNDQGFDYYFGTIGANDTGKVILTDHRTDLHETGEMGSLTGMFSDKAIEFIESHQQAPFFLYLAHTMPHTKLGASPEFTGRSKRGLYGDAVEEIDHHTGRILDTLKRLGLDQDTIVLFTSDNGPWLLREAHGGCALPLKDGKGAFWEGGLRVPAVFWGPGWIPGGRVNDGIMATMDILPTFAQMAGAPLPTDRTLDGVDQSALLQNPAEESRRDHFLYYVNNWLCAVRKGKWKLVRPNRQGHEYTRFRDSGDRPQLYDLESDRAETTDLAAGHPERVAELEAIAQQAAFEIGDEGRYGSAARVYRPQA